MTQKELLSLENLKIAEVKPGYFLHVHTNEGFYLTDWNKEDIKQFHASVCMYAPIRDTYNDYYIIDQSEYDQLKEEQQKAFEEEMKERENKMNMR